ncbi:Flp family type IVb pilin [Rhodoplanes azumiensis]|uniref:Flp family type IVb pilin n=1 Tax=Rhodoplanes azumiensis TaxID=1897628 RepID=A0ABW5ANX7_9BRAD
MRAFLKRFLHDERGATAIEYAIIAVGISVTVIAAVNAIGTGMKDRYETVSTKLSTVGQ